jgi:transcriptional regulator with XRE-family HTH domain/molybdate-binding protein
LIASFLLKRDEFGGQDPGRYIRGMANGNRLRRRRAELGLTQAELALSAGVSRQLVAAVEAGVNTPAVDAALRLAGTLECSAEELFAKPRPALRHRRPASRRGRGDAHGGPFVVAGCDPAIAVAEALLPASGSAALLALDATTGTALRSLHDGGVHAAVVHGRAGHLERAAVDVIRMQLAHWQVGLGLAPGVKVRTLAACLERGVPIVQRQESAASQQALRRAVRALGQELAPGTVTTSHVDAARAAAGIGCASITIEAAALKCGLRFIPLELHTVEVWVERRWEQHPGLDALGAVLTSGAFADRVSQMGGYDLAGCGTLLQGAAPV